MRCVAYVIPTWFTAPGAGEAEMNRRAEGRMRVRPRERVPSPGASRHPLPQAGEGTFPSLTLGMTGGRYNSQPFAAMGVSGNLKTMLPGDLLQWLSLGQKTGTLVVARQAVEKKIFFRAGRVISSASNDPREYLGQFLLSHGFLTEEELRKAMEVQLQSGILLGKILVTIGLITEMDLQRLMRVKAEEEIYDVFLWQEGEFHFVDDELPQMQMIPLKIDVTGIIMEGTRRVDEWPRIREVVEHDGMVPVMEKPVEPAADLDEVQRTVVHVIDGKRNITEIMLESRAPSFVVCSTIYSLVREGFVRMEDPTREAAEKMQSQSGGFPRMFDEVDEIQAMLNAAQTALKEKNYERTQRLLKAAQNLDPNHPKVRSAIRGAEAVILAELHNMGLVESKVPRVIKSFDEISQMNFSPNEGFLLSRINGTWDLGSIVKVSPIREPDAMLIFYKLWKDGIVAFD
ncbi:MAG TPA: DUF4388 domain-containing protein [Thermoanaerobaculia bacterium]|nr:DUF4388 domain-containing protein [Thermoanaerobaculia bacterium]